MDWSREFQEATKIVYCEMCGYEGRRHECIACSDCEKAFHKSCLDPLRRQWQEDRNQEYLCPECDVSCILCHWDDDKDDLFECRECCHYFHGVCIEQSKNNTGEGKDIPKDYSCEPNEEGHSYCPECWKQVYADAAEDEAWAKDHLVEDEQMKDEARWCRSHCDCSLCKEMNQAVDTWDDFKPDNPIQQVLKQAIDEGEGTVNVIMDNLAFIQD